MSEFDLNEIYSERRLDRLAFMADLIWQVLPMSPGKALPKRVLFDNAEEYYAEHRGQYLDAPENVCLSDTPRGDSWVHAGYANAYWADIKRIMYGDGRYVVNAGPRGVYGTKQKREIEKDRARKAKTIKKQADRFSYDAATINRAKRMQLPGIMSQVIQLTDGRPSS